MLRAKATRPGKAAGAATLLAVVAMLSVLTATASAMASLLTAGHHVVYWRLEREIAFRQAEVALADAEADLRAALDDPARRRLSPLPSPGTCGMGMQQGLCSPAAGAAAPWEGWLAADATPAGTTGVAVGRFTGTRVPAIAANAGGGARPPRYVIELLGTWSASGAVPVIAVRGTSAFRITAIGYGRDPAVRAVLQTEWLGCARLPPARRARHLGRVSWRELVPT